MPRPALPVPGFGQNGVVDLKLDDDQQIDLVTGEVGLHATPVVAGDTVIVGAAHRSGGVPRSKTNVKGYVRGFDVKTGKRLWIFHTIPQARRVRLQHLGEGFRGLHRQYGRLGPDQRG